MHPLPNPIPLVPSSSLEAICSHFLSAIMMKHPNQKLETGGKSFLVLPIQVTVHQRGKAKHEFKAGLFAAPHSIIST